MNKIYEFFLYSLLVATTMNHLLRSRQGLGSVPSRVLTRLYHPTTQARIPTPSSTGDSLRHRILTRAEDRKTSIIPVLNQWIQEGKYINSNELQSLIRQLRQTRRFNHALEISDWLNNEKTQFVSPGSIAIRLDLISKVHGLEQAEKYFNSMPETMRPFELYGALLNCYVQSNCLDKAEATMQKIRDLGPVKGSLSYNLMLKLYSQNGRHEKMDALMQEMEKKGINYDIVTFNMRLNAYVSASDVEGMEKFLKKMETNPIIKVKMDWNAYVVVANGYLKAGLIEKSFHMLKRSEQLITFQGAKRAYETLITLYTSCGRKDEVYRVWNLYKEKLGKFYNSGYIVMISSLLKTHDFDGAEMIYEEWESSRPAYDPQVPNLLITAFCKNGLMGKAETYINGLIMGGNEPEAAIWNVLASGYRRHNDMEKAMEAMRKAIMANSRHGSPNHLTLIACVDYLEAQGEGKEEELLKLLQEHGHDELVNKIKNRNLGRNEEKNASNADNDLDGEKQGVF